MVPDGHVLEERLSRTGREQVHVANPIPGRNGQYLPGIPVVQHLMVIPLGKHRNTGIETSDMGIQQVVTVVPAKLAQCLSHLRFFFGHPIFPESSIRKPHLGSQQIVGVDCVSAMDEELRILGQHGLVSAHATPPLINAITLTAGVARPDKMHFRARSCGRTGRHQRSSLPVTGHPLPILEAHPVEDTTTRREVPKKYFGGVIRLRTRDRSHPSLPGAERLVLRPFYDHTGCLIATAPDDCRCGLHIATGHSMGHERACSQMHGRQRADHGRGPMTTHRGQSRTKLPPGERCHIHDWTPPPPPEQEPALPEPPISPKCIL